MNFAFVAWIALGATAQQPPPAAVPAPALQRDAQVVVKQRDAQPAADQAAEATAEVDAPEETADQSPNPDQSPPEGPAVYTIRDERIAAAVAAVEDGRLVLATEPPRTLPFDEVLRIEPGPSSATELSAQWLGQDNHDLAGPNSSGEPNGIQDVHLRLSGLALGQEIKQIVALRRKPSPLRMWRMDTSRSSNWKLAIRRGKGARTADLFLEPIAPDFFDNQLSLTVTYDNGDRAKVNVTAASHTDHQLKVTADGPPAADAVSGAGSAVTVHLEGGDLLHGSLLGLTAETAHLRTMWAEEVQLPLIEVLGIRFDGVGGESGQKLFQDRLAAPGGEDSALVLSRDMNPAAVAGSCLGMAEGKLQFRFNEQTRSINLDRLVGLVFAAHPPVRSATALRQVVEFVNGDRVSGVLAAVAADSLELQLTGGKSLTMPRDAVHQVTFKNGRMVYLSDAEPLSVEEVPYFGRTWHYRRDAALDGGPLVIGGTEYKKGLAVHARCVLRYALDGQYELFKTRVGFDDAAAGRGAVACRVLADGRELFADPNLRADAEPVDIEVPIAGAGELTLEIDFGPREDTGDRVIWASARILRGDDLEEGNQP